jgi:SAM-dependent methyltransferase
MAGGSPVTVDEGFMGRQAEAWSRPPVDDVGYIPSADLLGLSDDELAAVVAQMTRTRYGDGGWRNWKGLWRDLLGLDDLEDLDVMDFGCGTGVESAQLARRNRVQIADIAPPNLALAARVMCLSGYWPTAVWNVSGTWPFLAAPDASIDVFFCSGVLHHIPWARDIMLRARQMLRPGGQVRLMLYSDNAWRWKPGGEPPEDVSAHPDGHAYARAWDQVGEYADWYDRDRIERRFGDLFTVERCEYMCPRSEYLGAVLRRRDVPR